MPILLLIRHATNEFVRQGRLPGQLPNIHLNAEGREQAKALAKMLSARRIDAVYSSHLERAQETALHVAMPHGLPVHVWPALADVDNGDWAGKPIKQLSEDVATRELWQMVVERPSQAHFPNGEGMLAMQRRVVDALERIIAAHPDLPVEPTAEHEKQLRLRPQEVVVVAHADVIKAALAHHLDMPFDSFQKLHVSPASLSALAVFHDPQRGRRWSQLLCLNVQPYPTNFWT
ncbi:MAG: histidine phosphatase family protein [Thermoflexales bacterium]